MVLQLFIVTVCLVLSSDDFMPAFEVLGPHYGGPSSSAGALRIALVARSLAPKQLECWSWALANSSLIPTLVIRHRLRPDAGILGLAPDDTRVREALTRQKKPVLTTALLEKGDDETSAPKHRRNSPSTAQITFTFLLWAKVRRWRPYSYLC